MKEGLNGQMALLLPFAGFRSCNDGVSTCSICISQKKTVGKGECRRFVRTGLSVERPKQEVWKSSIQGFQKGRQICAGT